MGSGEEKYHADPIEQIEITDVFDLHSFLPRDIPAAVEAYLDEAYARGFQYVRIIHGKGIGYQREKVRKILEKTAFVVSFGDAPIEAGGWGATVVTLSLGPR
ncbi:Smr/MutS family protein [Aetokthonos hydrillicola Thurmond2011]|uniref:Smr/MutS family protein n=1 Tax=Aetokthonos hydrillicola Thurmond2011 TaxID=2712845 RepID=A0AAP5IFW7_9CYAN|nr:Smr/MutS family protein [Aetokthonos hydrillicola]MDR9900968.1 Smr/MutS family protein [Aetokthonos hydrillicola Thurmond2011]